MKIRTLFCIQFMAFVFFFLNMHAPSYQEGEWTIIDRNEAPSPKNPIYDILMRKEEAARTQSKAKFTIDQQFGVTTFSKSQNLFQPSTPSQEWDMVDKPQTLQEKEQEALKQKQQALTVIEQTIKRYQNIAQDIANNTIKLNPSDEKILTNFLVNAPLFKSFITDPTNPLFPEKLRDQIREILKDPKYEKEYNQLKTAMLQAKYEFQQKTLESKEEQERDQLSDHMQKSLYTIKMKKQQEHQQSSEATKRKETTGREQQERTKIMQNFTDLFNKLKEEYRTKTQQTKINEMLQHETQYQSELTKTEQEEFEQLKKLSKQEERDIQNKNKAQAQADQEKISKLAQQESDQITQQNSQRKQQEMFDLMMQTKQAREQARKQQYLDALGEAKSMDAALFKKIKKPAADLVYTRQHVIQKYVNDLCAPFENAIENPFTAVDPRIAQFLYNIPNAALQNGARLKYYFEYNHIRPDFNIADISSSEQLQIFEQVAQKLQEYKSILL